MSSRLRREVFSLGRPHSPKDTRQTAAGGAGSRPTVQRWGPSGGWRGTAPQGSMTQTNRKAGGMEGDCTRTPRSQPKQKEQGGRGD